MSAIVSLAEIAPAQSSFVYDGSQAHAVALTPEVEDMLRANCVVAIGVSGGKDSVACALLSPATLTRSDTPVRVCLYMQN